MAKYSNILEAQLVVESCKKFNVKTVVISPGSRNAPLTIGFVNCNEIQSLQIVDERCAGFFALGIAQQTKTPVALVCTSGSALLNYYPAIAEAFYSRIPLIILSADRPKNKVDIGDGQTIRQENVFKNHILYSANLIPNSIQFNAIELQNAFQEGIQKKGPIHVNIPFEEPLYATVTKLNSEIQEFNFNTDFLKEEIPIETYELERFSTIWNASSKKMILIGEYFPNELIKVQLEKAIQDPSVIVLTETTSNLSSPKFINYIDKLIFNLTEKEIEAFQPEILITFGGMLVSKKIKQLLRSFPPKHHWHIDPDRAYNTFHCLSHHFKISATLFFSQFFFLTTLFKSTYQNNWIQLKRRKERKHEEFLESSQFSDLKAFQLIKQSIPKHTILQLGNSSVIRYSQLFSLHNSIQVFCNRGTSGIDGSTSTAIGAAYASNVQTTLVTGDLSFFYDSNALWNNYIKSNFRIIILNNEGGGIFRIIPGPQTTNTINYFETPHQLNAKYLCKMFGFTYYHADSEKSLKNSLKEFYKDSKQPVLLEIQTPRKQNDVVLKKYFANLKG